VGIVFYDLLLEKIPHGAYDVPMHWIATENELFSAKTSLA
jgi:5-formyltetrahydrofolate cyclo-ligase